MDISLLKESYPEESRVLLNPAGVGALLHAGHRVFVEAGAGDRAGWSDADYLHKGAVICYSKAEAIQRGRLIAKVLPPSSEELDLFDEDQVLVSFLLITSMNKSAVKKLAERRITAVALESIANEHGAHPFREAMSEIGGKLAVQMAGTYLQTQHGGRGILMTSLPSVPGAQVAILGAGTAGIAATQAAIGAGARVILLERFPDRLRQLPDTLYRHLETMVSISDNLSRIVKFVDVIISAVHLEDTPAPHVITADLVSAMKPGSVLVDLSIDQGGSIETARPTSLNDPVYIKSGVTHCCVPNLPAAVGRTASHLLTNLIGDLLIDLSDHDINDLLERNTAIRSGVTIHDGKATRQLVADYTGMELSAQHQ